MKPGDLVRYRGETVKLARIGARVGSNRNDAWILYRGNLKRVNLAHLEKVEE